MSVDVKFSSSNSSEVLIQRVLLQIKHFSLALGKLSVVIIKVTYRKRPTMHMSTFYKQ